MTVGFENLLRVEFRGFLRLFSPEKMKECNQCNISVSNKFGIAIPCSAIYVLEVSAHVSLKVANTGSFRGKKTLKNLHF